MTRGGNQPGTVMEDVKALLIARAPDRLCDDCIAERLQLSVRQHANHKTRQLGKIWPFDRRKGTCADCDRTKLVIRYSKPPLPSLAAEKPVSDQKKENQMNEIDTGTPDLKAEETDGVLILTMNRPDRRNALSREMLGAMADQLARAEEAPEVRCVVLTGAGGAFCAGGDVKAMAAGRDADLDIDTRIHRQRLSQRATSGRLHQMPKPTIAAIGGAAAGAGLALALACDLRVMAQGAILTTAFARVGFAGDYGGTYFLSQLVGTAKAREMYFLSDRVSAEEAERLGIVNRVVAGDNLMDETMGMARRLAAGPPIAYRYMKENLNRALGGDPIECMDLEVTHHVHSGMTEDHKNAAQAFVNKQEPVFKGR